MTARDGDLTTVTTDADDWLRCTFHKYSINIFFRKCICIQDFSPLWDTTGEKLWHARYLGDSYSRCVIYNVRLDGNKYASHDSTVLRHRSSELTTLNFAQPSGLGGNTVSLWHSRVASRRGQEIQKSKTCTRRIQKSKPCTWWNRKSKPCTQ